MNRNISEAHKNEYNPMYYSVDSTKAALPSLQDYRANESTYDVVQYENNRSEYERGYAEGFSDAREIYDCDENWKYPTRLQSLCDRSARIPVCFLVFTSESSKHSSEIQ